jgi:hypothetical protein
MTTSEITNQYELNLAETHLLRHIDKTCTASNPVAVETNKGDVIIQKAKFNAGFEAKFENSVGTYGATPSAAFLNLINKVKGN